MSVFDFGVFVEAVGDLGSALVPLAVPAIATWLALSWIADLLFRG